jgi:Raf kinase inhibitor-like YbhB/YbcL family protein
VRNRYTLAVSALACGALLACSSSDGRALPPPDRHQTTTSVSAPVVGQPSDGGVVEVFSLSSPAFAHGAPIPVDHTCTGRGVSPPLAWASTPPAAELALVVRDADNGGFVHWAVTGIDPLVQGLGEDGVPEGAVEAANGSGTLGWLRPCPPAGGAVHTYVFTLYALPEPLALAPGLPADVVTAQVEGAQAEAAVLTGTVAG